MVVDENLIMCKFYIVCLQLLGAKNEADAIQFGLYNVRIADNGHRLH